MDVEPIYDFLCCVHTWWLNGQLHRIDGPAFEDNNEKRWYTEGKLHRLDGPAMIWKDGSRFWYINGRQFTEEQFIWLQDRNITCPWDKETDAEFLLTWT